MPDLSRESLPESNVDKVTRDLMLKTVDFDGSGFVHAFTVLLARAQEHQRILDHSTKISRSMLAGAEPITQELVSAQAQDAMFETTCLKLFLACACRKVADDLQRSFDERQDRFRRITRIVFTAEGEVERFELEKL
jgi:hypothetical protein